MILQYRVRRKSLVKVLDEVQAFEDKMTVFMEKYPNYTYDLILEKETTTNPKWIVDLKITRHEREAYKGIEWD